MNEFPGEINALLVTRILKWRTEVVIKESEQKIPGKSGIEFNQDMNISSPSLWSVESPALYTVINEAYTVKGNERSKMFDPYWNNFLA